MRSLLAVLALSLASLPAMAGTYRFDTVHSQIVFSVGHDGFSHPVGLLHIADGWLRFDPSHWDKSFVELDIDLSGLDMGDRHWDKAVQGARYLDTDQYPRAHFVSTSVQRTGKHTGIMRGRLTVRGVVKPVSVIFMANRHAFTVFDFATVAGFSGYALLDRTDFGMTANPDSVGKHVSVRLEIEAVADGHARQDYQRARKHSS